LSILLIAVSRSAAHRSHEKQVSRLGIEPLESQFLVGGVSGQLSELGQTAGVTLDSSNDHVHGAGGKGNG